MNGATFIGLIHNAALLISLTLLYDTFALHQHFNKPSVKIGIGLFLGLIGIAIMLTTWEFMPGVIFDTRSVLLSLGGLFFGGVPALIAMVITGLLRLYQGGSGAWTGVAVIITSGTLGILWRHRRHAQVEQVSLLELYIFGVIVHVAMLLWMLTLSREIAQKVLSSISLPVMLIYPIGTVLLGKLFLTRLRRYRTELALRDREEQFRSLAENSQDYIVRYDREGRHLYANPAALQVSGVAEENLIGKTHDEAGYDPADSQVWKARIASVFATQKPTQDIIGWSGEDGHPTYLDWRLFPEFKHDGSVDHAMAIARDITPMKEAEDSLRHALEEKETLLRELYHRTKNTLQVIRSMLLLQAENLEGNEQVQKLVQDTETRIMAMALVHEKLYQSQNLSRIEMSDYLQEFVPLVLESFGAAAEHVSVIFRLEPIPMLIDLAIPCGLIVNELLTNAIKYAFPGKERGEITISLCRNSSNEVELGVADDGVGLPRDFDLRRQHSFGFQIMNTIIEHQLQGTFSLTGDKGVHGLLTFPDTLYTERV